MRRMIGRFFGKSQKPDVEVDGVFGRLRPHRIIIENAGDEPIDLGTVEGIQLSNDPYQ